MPRRAKYTSTASIPTSATMPGQVLAQVTVPSTKPWRIASTTWVSGLSRAIVCSHPWSSASGAYAVVVSTRMNIPACINGAALCALRPVVKAQGAAPAGGDRAGGHDAEERDQQAVEARPVHPDRKADDQEDDRRD